MYIKYKKKRTHMLMDSKRIPSAQISDLRAKIQIAIGPVSLDITDIYFKLNLSDNSTNKNVSFLFPPR